jgi:hypothetical protein
MRGLRDPHGLDRPAGPVETGRARKDAVKITGTRGASTRACLPPAEQPMK